MLAAYRDPLGKNPLILAVAADRQGRADAVPARPLRHAPQAARRRDRQDRPLPRPDHRDHRARRRASGRRTAATAWRRCGASGAKSHHRAGRAQARGRLADPRAQHREGAQPEGEVARGDPHLPRPDRRRRVARPEKRLRVLPGGGLARDARPVLREECRASAAARTTPIVRRLDEFSPTIRLRSDQRRTKSIADSCSSSTRRSPRRSPS